MKTIAKGLRVLIRPLAIIVFLSLVVWTCKYPSGPLKDNAVPDTRLANVPPNDTIAQFIQRNAFPELTLNWVGDDPDGYVIAFQYRWTSTSYGQPFPAPGEWSTHLNLTKPEWQNVVQIKGNPSSVFNVYNYLATLGPNDTSLIRIIGDSLRTRRAFAVPYKTGIVPTDSIIGVDRLILQTPTIGTFIFSSPSDSNLHKFEVRSVDNSGAIDPSPGFVNFWTLVSPGSVVVMDAVPPVNALAVRRKTDYFLGLRFAFHALDANNGFGIEYQWSVDDTSWSPWSSSLEARVTALDFKPVVSGTHLFQVRARNRWGVISPSFNTPFTSTVPRIDSLGYPKRILIINNDRSGNGTPGRPTNDQVDAFYREVMDSLGRTGQYTIWRTAPPFPPRWPPRDTLGNYTTILVLCEVNLPVLGQERQRTFGDADQAVIMEYLFNAGGTIIYSGSPNMRLLMASYANSQSQITGQFPIRVFHNSSTFFPAPYVPSVGLDFNGTRGIEGYPDLPLDPAKIAPDSLGAQDNIGNIGVNFPFGFAQAISTFDSRYNSSFEGLSVGIRFLAHPFVPPATRRTFSSVFFGHSLYYVQKSAVIQSLRKALQDIE
ncbi:MAG: hypothetical protein HW407_2033 [Bacteroidetes bacterium]|nr:hypothetical protein [Bacteroidota bacterium]